MKRIVRHINQAATEFWQFCPLKGWQIVPQDSADNWQRGSFEFIELRHNQEDLQRARYGGNLGPLILG